MGREERALTAIGTSSSCRMRQTRWLPGAEGGSDRVLRAREHLYRAGDRVVHPWLVVAGAFKSYRLHVDGEEQVLDFYMPGDIIGFDALLEEKAPCSVVALDTCCIRRLAIGRPKSDSPHAYADAERIIDGMYQELQRLTRRLMLATEFTHQRLAAYLLDYSERQHQRGFSAHAFRLPMGRRDLALYLGLATETLSRAFTRLRRNGLITVDNCDIELLDLDGLKTMAGRAAVIPWSGVDGGLEGRAQ